MARAHGEREPPLQHSQHSQPSQRTEHSHSTSTDTASTATSTCTPAGLGRGKGKGKGRGKRRLFPQVSPGDTEEDPSSLAKMLSGMVCRHKKNQDTLERQMTADPELEEHYFRSCAARIKKLSPSKASFLQIQITQLFYNAEHPFKQIPVTPFPLPSPPPERRTPHPPPRR